jgi:hypothetical protein
MAAARLAGGGAPAFRAYGREEEEEEEEEEQRGDGQDGDERERVLAVGRRTTASAAATTTSVAAAAPQSPFVPYDDAANGSAHAQHQPSWASSLAPSPPSSQR